MSIDRSASFVPVESFLSVCEKSSAKIVISAMRCTKLAGLGALSAFWVLNNNSNLYGLCSPGPCSFSADCTSERCAIEGGLKLESRMYSVFGCVLVGLTVRTTRNFDDECVKDVSADSRSGSIDRRFDILDAISPIVCFEVKSC